MSPRRKTSSLAALSALALCAREPAYAQQRALPPARSEWRALRVAEGCEVQLATTPSALDPGLSWRACPGVASGCLELAGNTGAPAGARVTLEGLGRGAEVTLAVHQWLAGPRARYLLMPRDGRPFFAVEGPRAEHCSLGAVGLSEDGAVVEVTFDHAEGYASRAYLRGPLAEDPSWSRVSAVLPRRSFPDFIGEALFSAGGRVVVLQNGGPLRWFDEAAARWNEVAGSRQGSACCASAHGDTVSFLTESIPERALAARVGEAARPLLPGPVDGVSAIALDGSRAAWVLGHGRDRNNNYQRLELWTGSFAPPATLTPERSVPLPRTTMAQPVLGGGVVALPLQARGAGLAVLLPAGPPLRVYTPPTGNIVERVLWVSRDELAVSVGPGGMHAEPSSVRRIAVASLPVLRP